MREQQLIRTDTVADGIVEIALSRPERRNALTLEMLDELSDAVDRVIGELDARVILLTGDGPSFCAGADLRSVHSPDSRAPGEAGLGAARVWEQLGDVPVPVIAVVQGHAMTGGLHLALCCDLIVAAEDAIFQDTHARFGLVPGSGEPQRYARRLGIFLAREMLLASQPFTGAEAAVRGFVARAVPAPRLREDAVRFAEQIAANSTRTVGYLKQMLNGGFGRPYGEAQWDDERLNHRGRLNVLPDPDRDARLRQFSSRTGSPS